MTHEFISCSTMKRKLVCVYFFFSPFNVDDVKTIRLSDGTSVTHRGSGDPVTCEEILEEIVKPSTGDECQPKPCAIGTLYKWVMTFVFPHTKSQKKCKCKFTLDIRKIQRFVLRGKRLAKAVTEISYTKIEYVVHSSCWLGIGCLHGSIYFLNILSLNASTAASLAIINN